MTSKCGFIGKCRYCLTATMITIFVMLCIYYFIVARVSHSTKEIESIDSTRVSIITQSEFNGKYKNLIPNEFRKKSLPADTAKIAVIEVVTRPADWKPSDKDILGNLEQFYYNTYDKLLGTLAILLSVFSVLIAFFGGLIPYLRSSEAERRLKEIDAKLKESQDTADNLEALKAEFTSLKEGFENHKARLRAKGERIHSKLGKIGKSYFELSKIDEATKERLEEYVDSTEMLEILGESLSQSEYLFRALYYLITNDEETFHDEFEKCIHKDEKSYVPYAIIGDAYALMNNSVKAIEYYDQALALDSMKPTVWYNKGNDLGKIGRYEEAIKCYDEAIRLKPNDCEAWNNKGTALCKLGKNEEAIKCYDEAIRLNPDYFSAWNNKGVALSQIGQHDNAISCFNEAIRIKPDFSDAWFNKACAFSILSHKDKMLEALTRAIIINPIHKHEALTEDDILAYRDDPDFKKLVE